MPRVSRKETHKYSRPMSESICHQTKTVIKRFPLRIHLQLCTHDFFGKHGFQIIGETIHPSIRRSWMFTSTSDLHKVIRGGPFHDDEDAFLPRPRVYVYKIVPFFLSTLHSIYGYKQVISQLCGRTSSLVDIDGGIPSASVLTGSAMGIKKAKLLLEQC